jgi:hypothetical protein
VRTFVRDAQPNARVRFRRAIERQALWMAEDAARELPNLPLEDALQLGHLYAERRSPKYEAAAMRWLERYLSEGSPRLQHFAEITVSLAKLQEQAGGQALTATARLTAIMQSSAYKAGVETRSAAVQSARGRRPQQLETEVG